MSYLIFELKGDMAMWRNPYESMGSFSALGPAPSNIAGILGAAMGFPSPRSAAANLSKEESEKVKKLTKNGLPWPVSPELLEWEQKNDYHVACRWIGKTPIRTQWNVNGYKTINEKHETLRMQQQIIENPSYEIVIRLSKPEAGKVASALKSPAFPLFLGASFCRGYIQNIAIAEDVPKRDNWAYREQFASGECVPFSRHVVNPEESHERILADGYWIYPVSGDHSKTANNDPFVPGYSVAEKKS